MTAATATRPATPRLRHMANLTVTPTVPVWRTSSVVLVNITCDDCGHVLVVHSAAARVRRMVRALRVAHRCAASIAANNRGGVRR